MLKLHVDDFGTGYSSLVATAETENGRALDRAFTAELGIQKKEKCFLQAIVSMAHALGMSVDAEGVETAEQLESLVLQ